MRHLQTLDTMRNAFTDEAVLKLLENNLSAKYALIGKLCEFTDICDVFKLSAECCGITIEGIRSMTKPSKHSFYLLLDFL